MSTSRQDPGYPIDESIKDAVGVLTAFCVPDGVDDALIDQALENALQNTDHTALVYNIGLVMRIMCDLGAQARGERPAEFARATAVAAMSAIEDDPQESLCSGKGLPVGRQLVNRRCEYPVMQRVALLGLVSLCSRPAVSFGRVRELSVADSSAMSDAGAGGVSASETLAGTRLGRCADHRIGPCVVSFSGLWFHGSVLG